MVCCKVVVCHKIFFVFFGLLLLVGLSLNE
jgi:hypothetical protein